jgi:hypothetical protein
LEGKILVQLFLKVVDFKNLAYLINVLVGPIRGAFIDNLR